MKRDPLIIIYDIASAIDGIETALVDKTFEEFRGSWLLRHGVQRGIEIISEAVRHLPPDLLDGFPEMPWPKIRAVGNVIRHEYNVIADEIIWRVAIDELPGLRSVMSEMRTRVEEADD
jgi:uncharacterized protein with HEPN domain